MDQLQSVCGEWEGLLCWPRDQPSCQDSTVPLHGRYHMDTGPDAPAQSPSLVHHLQMFDRDHKRITEMDELDSFMMYAGKEGFLEEKSASVLM